MKEELELIMNLIKKPLNKDSLKQLKQIVEKNTDQKYVKNILETEELDKSAKFLVSSRTMLVNYNRMLKYSEMAIQTFKFDMRIYKEKSIKMIQLLSVYRILLHELHHSKQIYNIFDAYENDIESEIIRVIYNIDKEDYTNQLETTTKEQIIETKTLTVNETLGIYRNINPIERKAEIESYKKIIEIITPIKNQYPEIYDYMHMHKLNNALQEYDIRTPFDKLIQKMEENNLPHKNINEIIIPEETTEIEKMELGLEVSPFTINQTEEGIQRILIRY